MLLFFYTTTLCAIIMPIRNPYIDDTAAEAIGKEEVGENKEEVSNGEDDPEESELSITSIFLILDVLMWI